MSQDYAQALFPSVNIGRWRELQREPKKCTDSNAYSILNSGLLHFCILHNNNSNSKIQPVYKIAHTMAFQWWLKKKKILKSEWIYWLRLWEVIRPNKLFCFQYSRHLTEYFHNLMFLSCSFWGKLRLSLMASAAITKSTNLSPQVLLALCSWIFCHCLTLVF